MRDALWFANGGLLAIATLIPAWLFAPRGRPDLVIVMVVIGAGCWMAFMSWTKVEGSRIAVRLDKWQDYGPGPAWLGLGTFFLTAKDYDLGLKVHSWEYDVMSKHGDSLRVNMVVQYRPDPDSLDEYFSHAVPSRFLEQTFSANFDAVCRKLTAEEIFRSTGIGKQNVPIEGGMIVHSIKGGVVDFDQRRMPGVTRDNAHLIESIMLELEDDMAIDRKVNALKELYPDKLDTIERIAEDRKLALRNRGLRENR